MSDIFTFDFIPPIDLRSESFVLFMTDVDHAKSDYDAVMASRNSLRLWSQSSWPEDSFTVEQNREDLAHHAQDNLEHSAYGYMIYSQDLSACYGSVYVNPLASVRDGYPLTKDEKQNLDRYDARIDYWTTDGLPLDLQTEIFTALRNWFKQDWKIQVLFSARRGMEDRQSLYQSAGLRKLADLQSLTSDVSLLLFD